MEQSQLTAAHWAEDDSDELFTECLKTLSIQSTELFILSRGFLSALEAHISLLSDVLSLQRDLHASIKMRAKSRIQLQRTIRAESLRRRRRRVGHDVSAAPANPGQAAQQSASGTQQAAAAPASPHPHQAAGSQPHWRAPGRRRSRNGRVVPQDVEPWSSSGALQRAKSASNSLSAHPANSTLVTNIAPSNIYLISKLKDKEHICRYKLDELDQMVHAKSERLDWAKRERVPRMLLALLEHYADMWLRYSELFNDMKEIVNTHKWWEISEEERAARSAQSARRGSGSRRSSATSPHRALRDDQSRSRRTELLRQWLETADDCSKIWEALRSIEERHLVDLVDWWVTRSPVGSQPQHRSTTFSLMPLSNDAGEVVSASAPPARQLCEIQPTYKQLCLTWMRALQASPPVTMVSQQHLTTTTGPTLPPLKRPSANVLRVLRMFSETLSQINSRECNVGQFLKDVEQAAADMKATQRQQEQLVASSISKYGALNQRRQRQIASQSAAASAQLAKKALALDTARYKVDRAMLDNRELRHKQLANAHMELWDALVGASKEFADGYRDIGMSFDSAQGDGQQQLSRMAMQGSNTSMAVSGGNGGMATAMSGGYGFGIFGQSASGAAASAGYTSGGPLSSFSTGKGVTMGSSVMGSRSVTVAISSQPPGTAVQAGSGIVSPVDTAPSEVEGTGAEAGPPPSLHHRMVYSPFEETKAGGAPPNVPLGAVSPDRSQMRSASKNSIRPMLDSTNSTSMPSLFGSSIRLSVDIPTVRVDAPAEEVWQQRRGSSPTQATALTGRPESAHTSSSRAAIRVDSQAMFGTPLSPIASLPSLATTAFGSAPDIQVQQPRRNDGSQQLSLSSSSSGSARPRASTVPTRSSDHSLESADLKGIAQLARIASEASSTHRSQADNSGPAVEQQAGDGHVAAAPQSIQKPPSSSAGSLDKHASASSAPTQQQPQPLTPSPAAVASALASQAGSTPSDPPARGPAPALVHHATVNAGSLVSPGRDNQPRGETLSEQSATVTPNLRTGGAPPVLPSVSFLDRAATASSSRNPFVDNGAGLIAAVSGTSLEDTYDAIQNQRRRESAPVAQAVDSARASMMAPGRPKTAKSFVSSIVMSMNTASSIHIPSEIASSASLQDRIEGQSVGTDYSTGMLDQSGVLTIAASASYGPRFFQLLRSGQDGSAPGLLSGEAAQSGASGAADTDNGSVIGVYGDRHGSESMYGRSAEQIDRSLTGTQSGGVYDADSTLGQISPRASTTSYQVISASARFSPRDSTASRGFEPSAPPASALFAPSDSGASAGFAHLRSEHSTGSASDGQGGRDSVHAAAQHDLTSMQPVPPAGPPPPQSSSTPRIAGRPQRGPQTLHLEISPAAVVASQAGCSAGDISAGSAPTGSLLALASARSQHTLLPSGHPSQQQLSAHSQPGLGARGGGTDGSMPAVSSPLERSPSMPTQPLTQRPQRAQRPSVPALPIRFPGSQQMGPSLSPPPPYSVLPETEPVQGSENRGGSLSPISPMTPGGGISGARKAGTQAVGSGARGAPKSPLHGPSPLASPRADSANPQFWESVSLSSSIGPATGSSSGAASALPSHNQHQHQHHHPDAAPAAAHRSPAALASAASLRSSQPTLTASDISPARPPINRTGSQGSISTLSGAGGAMRLSETHARSSVGARTSTATTGSAARSAGRPATSSRTSVDMLFSEADTGGAGTPRKPPPPPPRARPK